MLYDVLHCYVMRGTAVFCSALFCILSSTHGAGCVPAYHWLDARDEALTRGRDVLPGAPSGGGGGGQAIGCRSVVRHAALYRMGIT